MNLDKRLAKLEHKHEPPGRIDIWLYDLDGKTVTGPDGKRYTPEEAERMQEGAALRVDLRCKP
jgi:hypothetical protein